MTVTAHRVEIMAKDLDGPNTYLAQLQKLFDGQADREVILQAGVDPVTAPILVSVLLNARRATSTLCNGRPGRIATLLPDDWTTGALVLGATEASSVLPLNPNLSVAALKNIVSDAGVDCVVSTEGNETAAALGLPVVSDSVFLNGETFGLATKPARPVEPELILMTSGSTGTPKRVALPPTALLNRATVIAETLRLGPNDCALHALPMFHIGAFVDLLLAPLLAGGSVQISPERTARQLWTAAEAGTATWIQLVPTMMMDMLRSRSETMSAPQLRFVRSVSSGLSADLQGKAEEVFGCPVIQMYGMTETAGQICSNPLPNAPRKALSVGRPTGIDLEVRNAEGSVLNSNQVGEVFVKGPSVIAEYDRSDGLGTEWLATGDLGWLDGDGYLFLTGRVKEQINRGGEKIAPSVVEAAALDMNGVIDAAAFAVPHPTLGESVGLAVATPGTLSESALLTHLANHLAPFEMPRRIQIRQSLPRLPGGKLDRRTLAEDHAQLKARETALADDEKNAPPNVDPEVQALWCSVLETSETPDAETDFFDAGGDSLTATTFILELEALLGRTVSPNILFEHPCFGDLMRALDAPAPVQDNHRAVHFAQLHSAGWEAPVALPGGLARVIQTPDDRAPLFWCCQGFEEAAPLANWIDIGGLYVLPSLFGMPNRTEEDRDALADAMAEEMHSLYPSGPFVLGGYCEGARMMERVAKRMLEKGRTVRSFLSVQYQFEAETPYPVQHLTKRHMRGYPNGALSFQHQHQAGFEGFAVDAAHEDVVEHLHHFKDPITSFLSGQRNLARPNLSGLDRAARASIYRAKLAASPPWTWVDGVAQWLDVAITNRSEQAWLPSGTGGLTLMAMEVSPMGRVVDRYLGTVGWTETIAPNSTAIVKLPITLRGQSRPMLLYVGLVDQLTAQDLPFASGGMRLYPRWATIKRN